MNKRIISFSLHILLTSFVLFVGAAAAAPGDFDPTFGTNGQVINTIPGVGAATDVAIQPDGKIVLASSSFNASGNFDFAVLRLNPNGSPDNGFGTGGKVVIPFDNFANEEAVAVAVQADGKIVVVGRAEFGSPGYDFAAARLNADGSLDTTFGGVGKVKIPVSITDDFPSDVAVQADGKIVIVGKGFNHPDADAAVVRLNPNGTYDSTFNGNGIVITPIGFSTADNLAEVAIQPDGKIVAAGTNGSDFAVLRYNSNGAPDTTFDGDGIAITPVGTQRDEAFTVALQPDGKIVAGGSANSGSFDSAALVRYNPNGSLDTTFDTDGKTTIDVRPDFSESFKSVLIQADGKIIGVATGGDYILVRYKSNGTLDATFGTNGVKIAVVDAGQNGPSKAALQADGKLVVAGVASSGGFAVARFLTAGQKSPFDFDADGKTDISIFRPSNGQWWINQSATAQTIAAQFGSSTDKPVPADFTGDGKTDIAFFRQSTGEWFILRSEDASFYSVPFGMTDDIPVPADYDGDGKADTAVYRPSNQFWYIQRSSGGTTIVQFGVPFDKPVAADYDGDGKADVAIYRPSNGQWWINKSSDAAIYAFQFGTASDKPVQGDYTGDGKADAAFFRPSTGEWFILRSENSSFYSVPFGTSGDIPSPGDYDGDGRFDTAVFRPSSTTWYINRTTAGLLITNFGAAGDQPLPNVFVP